MKGHTPVSWRIYQHVGVEVSGVGECSNRERTERRVIYISCGVEKRGGGKRTQVVGSACYRVEGELNRETGHLQSVWYFSVQFSMYVHFVQSLECRALLYRSLV